MERDKEPEHLLIIRFSSLGDVVMTVPVVASLARTYPALRITVLSRDYMRPLFATLAPNVHFMGADLKTEYHGVNGLAKLFNRLAAKRFTMVADMHDVLRSKYLRMRLQLAGERVAHIHKNRSARQRLISQKWHDLTPQKTAFEKYADVLAKLNYPVELHFTSFFGDEKGDLSTLSHPCTKNAGEQWIGIAPFAAHWGKVYPLDRMEQIVKALATPGHRIFLFGSGPKELEVLVRWSKIYPFTESMIGRVRNIADDLVLMSHLDVMLSMDSANMHLASIVNVPVVSVWGATHPSAGFMGWGQSLSDVVSVDLPCRPCSIYGNKKCIRGDFACMKSIAPDTILKKVLDVLAARKPSSSDC